jgi:hypothetical protein
MKEGIALYIHEAFPTLVNIPMLRSNKIDRDRPKKIRKNQLLRSIFISYLAMVRIL